MEGHQVCAVDFSTLKRLEEADRESSKRYFEELEQAELQREEDRRKYSIEELFQVTFRRIAEQSVLLPQAVRMTNMEDTIDEQAEVTPQPSPTPEAEEVPEAAVSPVVPP